MIYRNQMQEPCVMCANVNGMFKNVIFQEDWLSSVVVHEINLFCV